MDGGQRPGYQGFGSFHSDNVEVLVAAAAAGCWQPPANPCAVDLIRPPPAFGTRMRSQFLIDFSSWCFLNHGAFGAPLRCAQEEAAAWRERCEAQPLAFLDRCPAYLPPAMLGSSACSPPSPRLTLSLFLVVPQSRELFPQLVRVLAELSTLLDCSPADLALLPNATTGLNAALAKFRGHLTPADAVFSLDIGYGMVKKVVQVGGWILAE